MGNNENLNNQVNESNNVQEKNKTIGIVILIIGLLLIGVAVYKLFIENPETDKPKDDNTQENNNQPQNSNNKLDGLTFKTSDGKNVLKIVSRNDKDALEEAAQLGIELNDDNDEAIFHRDYFGYYNDILFLIYDNTDKNTNDSKYRVLGGQEKGQVPQCRDTHEFVVNIADNTLVNFNNLSDGRYYKVHTVGEKYYFSEGGCAYGFVSANVYNEQLKRLGEYFFESDSNGNIYVLDNDYIIKYDNKENIIKKSDKFNGEICRGSIVYGDNLYFVAYINNKLYFVDSINNEKYQMETNDSDQYATIDGVDGLFFEFKMENGKIIISVEYYEDEELKYKPYYTFNPTTKVLIKNN